MSSNTYTGTPNTNTQHNKQEGYADQAGNALSSAAATISSYLPTSVSNAVSGLNTTNDPNATHRNQQGGIGGDLGTSGTGTHHPNSTSGVYDQHNNRSGGGIFSSGTSGGDSSMPGAFGGGGGASYGVGGHSGAPGGVGDLGTSSSKDVAVLPEERATNPSYGSSAIPSAFGTTGSTGTGATSGIVDRARDAYNNSGSTGHHQHEHGSTQGIGTNNTLPSSTGLGTGSESNNTFGQGQQARDTSSGYGNNNNDNNRFDNNTSSGFDDNNTSSRSGHHDTAPRFDNTGSSGYDSNNNNNHHNATSALGSGLGFDRNTGNRGSNKDNVNTDTYSGGAGAGGNTQSGLASIPKADAPSGIHTSKNANTDGGGDGWKAGVTGLTAEEAKWVLGDKHAPTARGGQPGAYNK